MFILINLNIDNLKNMQFIVLVCEDVISISHMVVFCANKLIEG